MGNKRAWLLVSLLLTAVTGGAGWSATVKGIVYFKGALEDQVAVGYTGKDAGGKVLTNMAGLTPIHGKASVWCDTYTPRRTALTWNPSTGLSFEHTHLPAGQYLLYVRYGETYLDTRFVRVDSRSRVVTVNLAIRSSQAGDLRVALSEKTGLFDVELTPLDIGGRMFFPEMPFGSLPSVRAETSNGAVHLTNLRAGSYRLALRRARRMGGKGSGSFTTYEDAGHWTVKVQAGKVLEYRLP